MKKHGPGCCCAACTLECGTFAYDPNTCQLSWDCPAADKVSFKIDTATPVEVASQGVAFLENGHTYELIIEIDIGLSTYCKRSYFYTPGESCCTPIEETGCEECWDAVNIVQKFPSMLLTLSGVAASPASYLLDCTDFNDAFVIDWQTISGTDPNGFAKFTAFTESSTVAEDFLQFVELTCPRTYTTGGELLIYVHGVSYRFDASLGARFNIFGAYFAFPFVKTTRSYFHQSEPPCSRPGGAADPRGYTCADMTPQVLAQRQLCLSTHNQQAAYPTRVTPPPFVCASVSSGAECCNFDAITAQLEIL